MTERQGRAVSFPSERSRHAPFPFRGARKRIHPPAKALDSGKRRFKHSPEINSQMVGELQLHQRPEAAPAPFLKQTQWYYKGYFPTPSGGRFEPPLQGKPPERLKPFSRSPAKQKREEDKRCGKANTGLFIGSPPPAGAAAPPLCSRFPASSRQCWGVGSSLWIRAGLDIFFSLLFLSRLFPRGDPAGAR